MGSPVRVCSVIIPRMLPSLVYTPATQSDAIDTIIGRYLATRPKNSID